MKSFISILSAAALTLSMTVPFATYADDPETATPESVATVEGSGIDLSANAKEKLDTFDAAKTGEAVKIANHSKAYKAQSTDLTAINAYSLHARGNSVYVAYDVNVTPGSSFSVTPCGNNGMAIASSFNIAGQNDCTIAITIPQNSNTINTINNNLACNTWYRVVMEIQQNGTAEIGTTAGALKYNIYKISAEDQTKSTITVEADGYARGLYNRAVTSIGVEVTGDVYIDNGVVYLNPQQEIADPATTPTPMPTPTPTPTPTLTPTPTPTPTPTLTPTLTPIPVYKGTIIVESITANVDDTITVPIKLSGNPGIVAYNFKIVYNKNVLTPISVSKGENFSSGFLNSDINQNVDISEIDSLSVSWRSLYDITDDGNMLILTFSVNEKAECGSYPINIICSGGDIYNSSHENIICNIINGVISVIPPVEHENVLVKIKSMDSVK